MLRLLCSLWQGMKMNRAMREDSPGDRCTACDGTKVVLIAPQAYRCNACGFEGGDGWAAYKEQQRHAKFAAMDPAARRASARDDLHEARRLLTSGIGDIEHARDLSGLDMIGLSNIEMDGEGNAKQAAITAGVGLLLEARNRARDAQAKLGVSLGTAATADGGGTSGLAASFDLHFDNIFTDLKVHRDIGRTLNQARGMLQAVDHVLAEQFGE